MQIEDAVKNYILANPPIALLIGDQYYPAPLPSGATIPAITAQNITRVPLLAHTGSSHLPNSTIQLTLWCSTKAQLDNLSTLLETLLFGYKGILDGIRVDLISIENITDNYDSILKLRNRFITLQILHYG